MKFQYFATLSLAAVVLSSSALSSFAAPPGSPDSPGEPRSGESRPGGGLSPEDRAKVGAVMEKVRKDPAVAEILKTQRTANREYNDTLYKAIIEKDPSLKDVLPGRRPLGPPGGGEKSQQPPAASEEGGAQRGRGRGPRGEGGGPGGKRFTPEDWAKVDAAREEARKNPDVAAAETKRDAANKALRDTLKTAILKEDPSLEPVIDKVVERMSRGGMMGRGPRREGPPRGGKPPGSGGEEGEPKGPPPVVNEGEPE